MAEANCITMMGSLIVKSPTDMDDDKAKKPLSFLSLPPEIRNKIYRYSLIEPPSVNPIFGLTQPPLTRTNRLIRSEALPVYYGNNQFLLDILPKPRTDDTVCWANVIRMFREFKASRTGGRGTGSLHSLRHLTCRVHGGSRESFLILEVVLIDSAKRRARKRRDCRGWDSHAVCRPKDVRLLQRRDLVYKVVEKYLGAEEAMHESVVRHLISIVAMVANECPAATKEVHFHSHRRWDELDRFENPFDSDLNDS